MMAAFLADCRRVHRSETLSTLQLLKLTAGSAGLKALLGYRLGRHLLLLQAQRRQPLLRPFGWLLYGIISGYARHALDINLDLSADIGAGLYIGHFGNIAVRHCELGSHCSIAQSVHIEPDDAANPTTGPTIGDRVWIGGHAKIIGSYQIGDRCTIGAGAAVKRDIPSGALFMGNPGRVVMSDYDNTDIL
jgi:serine acetyltransferase